MAEPVLPSESNPLRVTLKDGTPALIRPIRPDGGAKLAAALQNLSPNSRYQRFLSYKKDFTADELEYLTKCDGVDHLALVLVILDSHGREKEPVAVARCVRDKKDAGMGEVAIVVADSWQRDGVGQLLFQALAERSLAVGIERWAAILLGSNLAARRLMDLVGTKESERFDSPGVLALVYRLNESK